jgi:small subunit ribosomal protein S17
MTRARYGHRKTRVGVVVSDKMDKTVVVAVQTLKRHRLYKKMMRRDKRYSAHDEENACQVGDRVLIVESRPLSRAKRWRVAEVLVAAAIPEAERVVIEEETPEEIRELDEAAAAARAEAEAEAAARAEAEAAARAEAEAAARAEAAAEEAEALAEEAAPVAEAEQPPTEEPEEAAPEEAEAPATEEPPAVQEIEAAPEEEERSAAEVGGEPAPEAEEEEKASPEPEQKEEQAPES